MIMRSGSKHVNSTLLALLTKNAKLVHHLDYILIDVIMLFETKTAMTLHRQLL